MSDKSKTKAALLHELARAEAEELVEQCVQQLEDEESKIVNELLEIRLLKKGEHLMRAGDVPTANYGIVSGCIRQYYLVNGEEKTTFFYTTDHSIYSLHGTSKGIPVKYYLTCVEDTSVTVLSYEKELELFERCPRLSTMSRNALKEELANFQEMLATHITSSPEERYNNLLTNRPDLINRVPQYQLASYLGVTPESLSRIRKRMVTAH